VENETPTGSNLGCGHTFNSSQGYSQRHERDKVPTTPPIEPIPIPTYKKPRGLRIAG